jgi:exopolyphosphatase/pppGpp-phosphohydrolase
MSITNKILIDVGSSTVKIYRVTDKKLELLFTRSISFKKDFDPNKGISADNKKTFYTLIGEIKEKYKGYTIKLYATAIFRKLTIEAKVAFIDDVFHKTGLFFNIISHELENFYLEVALTGQFNSKKDLLLVNIGGGSTELVVLKNRKPVEKHNIELGIGTILAEYPSVNDSISGVSLQKVLSFIKSRLPRLEHTVQVAFYNGGELRYMQLVGYTLIENFLFEDEDHPSVISLQDFQNKNEEVFKKVTLAQLESLMPSDPKWMHGARACSAIAQSIFEQYHIQTIIPSNSNLVDGVVRQECRQVTISGSFRKHLDYILKVKQYLTSQNIQVLSPRFTEPKNPGEEFVVFEGEEDASPIDLERYHLNAINESDALIVCNPNGYVGASAMIEIGFAHSQGKRIIFVEKPEEFMLNTLPAEVGL